MPQFRSRRHLDKPNSPRIEQRHDLLETIARCISRNDRVRHLVAARRFAHLIHSHYRTARAYTQADQAQHFLARDIVHVASSSSLLLLLAYAVGSLSPPADSSPAEESSSVVS